MYRRILVPLDGSALAERALPEAEELARLAGASMHLIRVVDLAHVARYGSVGLSMEVAAFELLLADEEIAARGYLERTAHDLQRRGLSATAEVRRGHAASEIVGAATGGDVIVMATHGRGGVTRWFLGSVAEAVVRRSPVPVLLVRGGLPADPPAAGPQEAAAVR